MQGSMSISARWNARTIMRFACKATLVICLPVTGFIWAHVFETHHMIWLAIYLTVMCLGLAAGAEMLLIATENEVVELEERLKAKRESMKHQLDASDEKLKKMDRMAKILEDQNHDMRAELITTLVRLQKDKE